MHCYKSEGTRLSVSQVRLPLGRKGDNHWAITGELGGKKILEIHGACSRAPNACMQFYITAWHLGKVGRGRKKIHNQIKAKRGTNEVTWTRCHLGLVKLLASDELVTFLWEPCSEEGQHRNISWNSSLVRKLDLPPGHLFLKQLCELSGGIFHYSKNCMLVKQQNRNNHSWNECYTGVHSNKHCGNTAGSLPTSPGASLWVSIFSSHKREQT